MLEAAKKEGRVVAAIPTSAELRKELESGFQAKFPGIELEVSVSRGASNTNKIVEEQNAAHIDVHLGGDTGVNGQVEFFFTAERTDGLSQFLQTANFGIAALFTLAQP